MTSIVTADNSRALRSLHSGDMEEMLDRSAHELDRLVNRTGPGAEFTGWLDLPDRIGPELLRRIDETATSLRNKSDVVVLCGIGGSYLGARAGLDFLETGGDRGLSSRPAVLYAGNNLSPCSLRKTLEQLADREFSVIVVSKSGTTLETMVAFHMLWTELVRRFGEPGARSRVIAVTDPTRGVLRTMAIDKEFVSFDLPQDVSGRYSVLTPVGLLPFAVRGFDVHAILQGAAQQRVVTMGTQTQDNDALLYAATRRLLGISGKTVELLANFEPSIHYLAEWWKQLFGESEGKAGKGIFPATADYTTDLHSLGQFVQQGSPCLFETVMRLQSGSDIKFTSTPDLHDNLDYLNGVLFSSMNQAAEESAVQAHDDGGIPVIQISVADTSERSFGAIVFFFQLSCAIGGYLLGVDPFNQPGVEMYKHVLHALLATSACRCSTDLP